MPDPPDTSLFTRFVLENPYPLAALLAVMAAALIWLGLRDQRREMRWAGVALLVAGGVTLGLGTFIVTPAERATAVTRELVRAVEQNDTDRALGMIADGATFTISSPRNPGMDIDYIRSQLRRLTDQQTVDSIMITSLSSYTQSPSRAEVHLACRAQVGTRLGISRPTPSEWVLRIEEQSNGEWKVTGITAVSIAGQTPTNRLW